MQSWITTCSFRAVKKICEAVNSSEEIILDAWRQIAVVEVSKSQKQTAGGHFSVATRKIRVAELGTVEVLAPSKEFSISHSVSIHKDYRLAQEAILLDIPSFPSCTLIPHLYLTLQKIS